MCGDTGMGGMAEVDTIVHIIVRAMGGYDYYSSSSMENLQHELLMDPLSRSQVKSTSCIDAPITDRSLTPSLLERSRRSPRLDFETPILGERSHTPMGDRSRRRDIFDTSLLERSLTPSLDRTRRSRDVLDTPLMERSLTPSLDRLKRSRDALDTSYLDRSHTPTSLDRSYSRRGRSDFYDAPSGLDRSHTPSLERLRRRDTLDTPTMIEPRSQTPSTRYGKSVGSLLGDTPSREAPSLIEPSSRSHTSPLGDRLSTSFRGRNLDAPIVDTARSHSPVSSRLSRNRDSAVSSYEPPLSSSSSILLDRSSSSSRRNVMLDSNGISSSVERSSSSRRKDISSLNVMY